MPTLYLFPGAHKTGTSYLQKALETCRGQIEAMGYGLAKRGRYYSDLHDAIRMPITDFPATITETLENAKGVFGVPDLNRDLILSIENLFGEFSNSPYKSAKRVIMNFKALFPDHRVKCVFYVRRQDTFLESNYVQSIHKGQDWDWPEFWEKYRDVDLNWFEIIGPIKRNLDDGDFVLKPFESLRRSEKLFLREFFEQVDGFPADTFVELCAGKLKDTNVSLSTKGMEIVRAGFPLIESRGEREKYARHMQLIFGVDKGPRFKMPEATRMKIAEAYAHENRRLLRRHNCAGGVLQHYVFSELLGEEVSEGIS